MPLLVLAGGFGTRLKSVLNNTPKALAPINGEPFLYFQIERWIDEGVRSFVFLLHHHSDAIIDFLNGRAGRLLGECQVRFIIETRPLGTGGAVTHAIKELGIKGDFLLANADTWLGSGVSQVVKVASPSILAVQVGDVGRYGGIEFNSDNIVTAFTEKKNIVGAGWINAGVSLMNSNLFKDFNQPSPFSLEGVVYPSLTIKNILKALPIQTEFIDIGIPEDYYRFCRWIESEKTVDL